MIDLKNVLEIERNNKIVQKIQTTEKRLPSEYQEVEYIQNTSGQYIDTDINTVEGTFETDIAINENVEKVFIFGSLSSTGANALSNTLTYKLMWQVGANAVVQQPMISDTNIHRIRMKTDVTNNYISIELDEEHSDLLSSAINLNNLNIYLFGRNNNGSLQQYGGGEFKCYSFKYWNKNNVLIRNLIPCYRKVDNKSGMYDLVSNTFFPNQGSMEFILGQETDNYKIIYEGYKNLNKSGNLPIVIKNSGNPAINYKIYGNLNRPDTPSKDNPATIYTVGDLVTDSSDTNYGKYKIPVRATGKNILPGLIKGRAVNTTTGEIGVNPRYASSDFIELYDTDNEFCYSGLSSRLMSIAYAYNENKEYMGRTSGVATKTRVFDRSYFVHSTTSAKGPIKYIIVAEYATVANPDAIEDVDNLKPQLEVGDTETAYEAYKQPFITNIYLDEPLRGISNQYETKIDYIDFGNQKVYRNIAEKIFTGNESWGKITSASNPDYFRYYMGGGGRIYGSLSSLSQFCNYFVWAGPTTGNQQMGISLYVSSDNNYIRFRDSELTSADLIKNFMEEKYDSGEPVKFVYTKNTESEENVTLPSILLQKGINIISIGTELQPRDFYIKYKGK